ncbi:hypothetical protein RND71_031959 [Anisodus tanguticus]|uniref:Uncharacterized protein n=1 Tax=Anisodus tanguticus TaxID=243964 RepID=A0AAE1RDC9_9SOLA|nr:hypothetical protein RND71_031959 [Anisodus tanguticus]
MTNVRRQMQAEMDRKYQEEREFFYEEMDRRFQEQMRVEVDKRIKEHMADILSRIPIRGYERVTPHQSSAQIQSEALRETHVPSDVSSDIPQHRLTKMLGG